MSSQLGVFTQFFTPGKAKNAKELELKLNLVQSLLKQGAHLNADQGRGVAADGDRLLIVTELLANFNRNRKRSEGKKPTVPVLVVLESEAMFHIEVTDLSLNVHLSDTDVNALFGADGRTKLAALLESGKVSAQNHMLAIQKDGDEACACVLLYARLGEIYFLSLPLYSNCIHAIYNGVRLCLRVESVLCDTDPCASDVPCIHLRCLFEALDLGKLRKKWAKLGDEQRHNALARLLGLPSTHLSKEVHAHTQMHIHAYTYPSTA